MGNNDNGARISVLEARMDNLEEVKQDVKAVLSKLGTMEVSLAKLPTWDHVGPIDKRVQELEKAKSAVWGGSKVLVAVSSILGGIVTAGAQWAFKKMAGHE